MSEINRLGILCCCGDCMHDADIIAALEKEFGWGAGFGSFDKLILAGGSYAMRDQVVRDEKLQVLMADAVFYRSKHGVNRVIIVIAARCDAYGGNATITEEQRNDASQLAVLFSANGFETLVLEVK